MVRRTERNVSAGLRPAFTLVELLVVIIIIAIIAGIAVPAVMKATGTAQNARIKTEIDMLHQAVMQYKNEYGSFPPATDPFGAAGNAAKSTVYKHLQRVFPRVIAANLPTAARIGDLDPSSSLTTWLSGYADDPTNPLGYNAGTMDPTIKRKKLFEFDSSRISSAAFAPPNKPKSPYIYIDSVNYDLFFVTPYSGYFPHRMPLKTAPTVFNNPTQPYFNPDSFQIICAGRDEKFGTDDDMSNFWPGTRKDYIDSLK